MKISKKLCTVLSLMLSLLLLISLGIPITASAYSDSNTNVGRETKQLCNATIDDDFSDNRVIVAFNNDSSLELKNYTLDDFPEIGIKNIYDLSSYKVNEIKEKFTETQNTMENVLKNLPVLNFVYSNTNISNTNLYNQIKLSINQEYDTFHRILRITLNKNSKQNVLDVIHELENRSDVLFAEPDYKMTLNASATNTKTPNDTYLNNQWAIDNIDLEKAWSITTGSSEVKVAIADSGIKSAHSDLKNNVDVNLSKSFVDNSPCTDELGHGTHVAGIVGAVGNNNRGIAGACWNVSLVSLKVFDSSGGQSDVSDLADAINYAQANDINIINYSGSFSGSKSNQNDCLLFQETLKNYDGLFICSAGNLLINIDDPSLYSSNEFSNYKIYPSAFNYDNIISVAAINQNNSFWFEYAKGSNYGAQSVDLAAPGANIYSTYNGDTSDKYYAYMSGTSMAAPYVTGVAALIKSKYPTITTAGIKEAILDGTVSRSALSGKVLTGGSLNAYNALQAVENCKYTISYNKNGGSGSTMQSISTYYGVAVNLSANQYTNGSDNLFAGWKAYRTSDGKWCYGNSTGETEWFSVGSQPSGYTQYKFKDEATVSELSKVNNDTIILYAQWVDKDSVLLGDLNLDGSLSIEDVTLIQKYIGGSYKLDEVQRYAADVNSDGFIDIADVTALQRLILTAA